MKRILRVTLWAFMYWFAGAWWLSRYFEAHQWHLIADDLVMWAMICVGIEATRMEAIKE